MLVKNARAIKVLARPQPLARTQKPKLTLVPTPAQSEKRLEHPALRTHDAFAPAGKKKPRVGHGPLTRMGGRGKPVAALQWRLSKLGYHPGPIDGIFGRHTLAAVKSFQRHNHLVADGIVGRHTWGKLGINVHGRVHYPRTTHVPSSSQYPGTTWRVRWAIAVAHRMGLTVTSTTGGRHVSDSYHYRGRAVDVAGSYQQEARFFRYMLNVSHRQRGSWPTELFFDPLGGYKFGRWVGAIGGHRDHVHVAF